MATAKKSARKKTAGVKSPAKKSAATASPAKKAAAKKPVARKSAVKGAGSKGTASKKGSGQKYGPLAGQEVAEEMREMKRGELTIGRSDKKVTNPKQAIAIGLAKARREGGEVPPNPNTGR